MQVLTVEEMDLVFGGDRWAGTPEGRAPADSGDSDSGSKDEKPRSKRETFADCMVDPAVVKGSQGRAEIAGTYCGFRSLFAWFGTW